MSAGGGDCDPSVLAVRTVSEKTKRQPNVFELGNMQDWTPPGPSRKEARQNGLGPAGGGEESWRREGRIGEHSILPVQTQGAQLWQPRLRGVRCVL